MDAHVNCGGSRPFGCLSNFLPLQIHERRAVQMEWWAVPEIRSYSIIQVILKFLNSKNFKNRFVENSI